jgi:hypothetical protein
MSRTSRLSSESADGNVDCESSRRTGEFPFRSLATGGEEDEGQPRPLDELLDEPALADSATTPDRDEPTRAVRPDPFYLVRKSLEVRTSPNETFHRVSPAALNRS